MENCLFATHAAVSYRRIYTHARACGGRTNTSAHWHAVEKIERQYFANPRARLLNSANRRLKEKKNDELYNGYLQDWLFLSNLFWNNVIAEEPKI